MAPATEPLAREACRSNSYLQAGDTGGWPLSSKAPGRCGIGSQMIRRWRKTDSNCRSPLGRSAQTSTGTGGRAGCSRPRWSITMTVSRCRRMCGSPLSRMPQQSKLTGKPCLAAAAKARFKPGWSASIGRPSRIRMRMPRAPGVVGKALRAGQEAGCGSGQFAARRWDSGNLSLKSGTTSSNTLFVQRRGERSSMRAPGVKSLKVWNLRLSRSCRRSMPLKSGT